MRGVACPDCGSRPDAREVDLPTQKRRSAASRILEKMDADSFPPPSDYGGALDFDGLSDWLMRAFESLGDLGSKTAGVESIVQLEAVAGELSQHRLWMRVHPGGHADRDAGAGGPSAEEDRRSDHPQARPPNQQKCRSGAFVKPRTAHDEFAQCAAGREWLPDGSVRAVLMLTLVRSLRMALSS